MPAPRETRPFCTGRFQSTRLPDRERGCTSEQGGPLMSGDIPDKTKGSPDAHPPSAPKAEAGCRGQVPRTPGRMGRKPQVGTRCRAWPTSTTLPRAVQLWASYRTTLRLGFSILKGYKITVPASKDNWEIILPSTHQIHNECCQLYLCGH